MKGVYWKVLYETHFFYKYYSKKVIITPNQNRAFFIFYWYYFCFIMSPFPVKRVSITKVESGVSCLRGRREYSQNKQQIKLLEKYKDVI